MSPVHQGLLRLLTDIFLWPPLPASLLSLVPAQDGSPVIDLIFTEIPREGPLELGHINNTLSVLGLSPLDFGVAHIPPPGRPGSLTGLQFWKQPACLGGVGWPRLLPRACAWPQGPSVGARGGPGTQAETEIAGQCEVAGL